MSNLYPIVEAVERRRFLDWRFLAALAALVLVGFLVWAGFRNYELREAEAEHKDALIEQLAGRSAEVVALEREVAELTDRIAELTDRARADRQEAREERRSAARERSRLLRQQERMLELLRAADIDFTPTVSYRSAPAIAGTSATSRSEPAQRHSSAPTAGKSGKTPPGKAKGLRK